MQKTMDGLRYVYFLENGIKNVVKNKKALNDLNVFPVPDGDTGTNMVMTLRQGYKAIEKPSNSLSIVANQFATSAVFGARGNSGVILSQLIRGMQKALVGVEYVDCNAMEKAFSSAAESAYRAVMKPTEGTILTVARCMAEAAREKVVEFDSAEEFMGYIVDAGNLALSKTPQMLPQLAQAGVVDSGGQGLMYLVEGALEFLRTGIVIERDETDGVSSSEDAVETTDVDIKFSYCTECIIEKKDCNVDSFKFKTTIEMIGDSMVIVDDDEIIKVHIHTNQPDVVLCEALKLGELSSVKIENMKIQHNNIIKETKDKLTQKEEILPAKKYAFAAVSAGDGIADTFTKLGIDVIISGGQTMNPSTDDILSAISNLNAENIVVFPNNKNIIMAAEQAREISDKNIIVIPTKSVTQAISCMFVYNEEMTPDSLSEAMNEAKDSAVSAQITYAVRDTVIDDKEIVKGDILGIVEGKIRFVDKTAHDSVMNIIKANVTDDTCLVSLFYGCDVSEDEAQSLADEAEELYPDVDFSVSYGGQPVYDYFISIE
jgi:DAK2 domain fusion protein YloV